MRSRKGLIWLTIAAVVLAGLLLAYLVQDREHRELDAETRARLPGQFIQLRDGFTHYEWTGPANGEVVVLVHGFSAASYTWERNVPALAAAGYRVLTYDLYGRGYSDRVAGPYDLNLFTRQLDELLTGLGISRPVDLAGISMGGYIAGAYAAAHPEGIARLALLAPQSTANGSDARLTWVKAPLLGDYLFAVYICPQVMVDKSDEFKDYGIPVTDWHDRYLDMMQYKGFRRALLSTLRDLSADPLVTYRQVGQTHLPVMLVWGDQDTTVPISYAAQVQAAIPQAKLTVIPGAGHPSIYQKPAEVNAALIDFFGQ
jgi:pimeloyl-ACP methyl ester carboxylesterase